MASVLQLCRQLTNRPELPAIAGLSIRTFTGPADIVPWLDLRHRAFARERLGVRRWAADDFAAELTSRWWWQPKRMWLAEADGPQLVGSVTLAMRGEPEAARPVVHWLMVHPTARRRGLGRLLMAHLEAAAWDAGHRQLWLETHAAWQSAEKFYTNLGYAPV